MRLVPRWMRRPTEVEDAATVETDETIAQVSAQVAELRRALRRIESREAARRHGRPEPA